MSTAKCQSPGQDGNSLIKVRKGITGYLLLTELTKITVNMFIYFALKEFSFKKLSPFPVANWLAVEKNI